MPKQKEVVDPLLDEDAWEEWRDKAHQLDDAYSDEVLYDYTTRDKIKMVEVNCMRVQQVDYAPNPYLLDEGLDRPPRCYSVAIGFSEYIHWPSTKDMHREHLIHLSPVAKDLHGISMNSYEARGVALMLNLYADWLDRIYPDEKK